MIKKKKLLAIFYSFIFFFTSANLFSETYTAPAYTNPLAFFQPGYLLQVPVGARAQGMGAFTAMADDLSAVYYNPAGLKNTEYWELQLSHRDDLYKVDMDSIVTNIPLPLGSLAFYGLFAHVADYDNTYYGVTANPYKNYKAGFVGMSYGANVFRDLFSFGFGVKYFQSSADTLKEYGMLVDLALQYNYDLSNLKRVWSFLYHLPRMSLTFAAMNIHPRFNSSSETTTTDPNASKEFTQDTASYNVGISFYTVRRFAWNIDFINPSQGSESTIRTGLEIWPIHFLALRSGIGTRYFQDQAYTYYAGFGLGELFGKNHLSFEYSYEAPFLKRKQNGESMHQVSLVSSFGGWRYQAKYADDRGVKLTNLIQGGQNLQIVDNQTWGATAKGSDNIVSLDRRPEIAPSDRQWILTVFRYQSVTDQKATTNESSDKVTNSVTKAALDTGTVKLIAQWKQNQIATQFKQGWGETEEKFLHRLGATLGTDFIIVGGIRLSGASGLMIQTRVFEVHRKIFVLDVKSNGMQIELENTLKAHLKAFQQSFGEIARKKKSTIPM